MVSEAVTRVSISADSPRDFRDVARSRARFATRLCGGVGRTDQRGENKRFVFSEAARFLAEQAA